MARGASRVPFEVLEELSEGNAQEDAEEHMRNQSPSVHPVGGRLAQGILVMP